MATSVFAPAKINLALHLIGQRSNGYHELDSIVAFADVGDQITLEPSDAFSLTIDGPFAQGLSADEDNLVLRAARAVGRPVKVHLTKNLPIASGIGGGSADCAAVFRALGETFKDVEITAEMLLSMGADVPVCFGNRACIMAGVGEVLTPLIGMPDLYAVLVNPMRAVSTGAVFGAIANKNNPPLDEVWGQDLKDQNIFQMLGSARNDMQTAAIKIEPEIGVVLRALDQSEAIISRMSGSGATCFGLYETHAEAVRAGERLRQDHPDFWVVSTVLRGSMAG